MISGKRSGRRLAALVLLGVVTTVGGCGLRSSAVEEGPEAPTGLAPGVTLYFLDENGELTAQQRQTGRLGTIQEAVSLLLLGAGDSGLDTGIEETPMTRTAVSISGEVIELRLPLASYEVDDDGTAQIVCTALATHIQSGGSDEAEVLLRFTDIAEAPRSCPVL